MPLLVQTLNCDVRRATPVPTPLVLELALTQFVSDTEGPFLLRGDTESNGRKSQSRIAMKNVNI